MKTHTIKTPKAELLIVELPENIERDYSLIYGNNPEETYLSFRKNAEFKPPQKSEKLANGIWKSLGKPDEIKEEVAKQIISTENYVFNNQICRAYIFHGNQKKCYTESAKKSLLSLLESEIYWENPTPLGDFVYSLVEWHEVQSRTFDKSRSLIFKKN